jgi:hypothetical protein
MARAVRFSSVYAGHPQLPGPLTPGAGDAGPALKPGCYLLSFTLPDIIIGYKGTLRAETSTGALIASGDLYTRHFGEHFDLEPLPDPKAGIPIFPIPDYRYYLRVTRIDKADSGFAMSFEALRFSPTDINLMGGRRTRWVSEDSFTAMMKPARDVPPPEDPGLSPPDFPTLEEFPSPDDVFIGGVTNSLGDAAGTMKIGLVSEHLRKAILEMDRVPLGVFPTHNDAGETVRSLYANVGWDFDVIESDTDVVEPAGPWTAADAHQAMMERRAKTDLNTEWHYHLLAVRKIKIAHSVNTEAERQNGERGFMYDQGGDVPREGLMIAADWQVPDDPSWGRIRGMRFADATSEYLRTTVHELGHALSLDHNVADNGFMNTSDVISKNGQQAGSAPFPDNVLWSFARDDQQRLRHWPDIVVRPGGITLPARDDAPSALQVSDRHRLDVTADPSSVPLGAPVRVNLHLTNIAAKPADTPAHIGLGAGFVRGLVIDSQGIARSFSPLVVSENRDATQFLAPGGSIDDSLTLLQGAEGALFPEAGAFRVVVEIAWNGQAADATLRMDFVVSGEARVTVTAATDAAHAAAARKVLATPQSLLVLAFGGDHLTDGIDAIAAALKSDALRPHFSFVEAKRRATAFGRRKPDLKAAADLIDGKTVMSPAELRKAVSLVKDNAADPNAAYLAKSLKTNVKDASGAAAALVRAL